MLIHSLSVSAETLVVEWELARGDGDGDGGRRGGGCCLVNVRQRSL